MINDGVIHQAAIPAGATGWSNGIGFECPVCGKMFPITCNKKDWAYKIKITRVRRDAYWKPVCSWKCQRQYEREKDIPLDTPADDEVMIKAVKMVCENVRNEIKAEEQPKEGNEEMVVTKETKDRVGRFSVLIATGMDWKEAAVKVGWKVYDKNPSATKLVIRQAYDKLGLDCPECLLPSPIYSEAGKMKSNSTAKEEPKQEEPVQEEQQTPAPVESAPDIQEEPKKPISYIGSIPEGVRIKEMDLGNGLRVHFNLDNTVSFLLPDGDELVNMDKDGLWSFADLVKWLWGLL